MSDLGPLEGFTVLDMTNVLAGPFAGYQLAQLGARVIKVESLDGDLARQLGSDPARNQAKMGVSFTAQNAGKESIALNLKTEQGRTLFYRLVTKAHVVIENFRPGAMQRLECDFKTLCKHNPNLVYCAISGFGQDGPMSHLPAYDQIVQGMSGTMQVTGTPEQGVRVGYPIADTVGGLTAAMAISAALHKKTAQFIDVSMLESLMSTMGWVISNFLQAGTEPQAWGNENPTSAPSGSFKTRDGDINIAANQDAQWERLANAIGIPELLKDSRFLTREDRKANRGILSELIDRRLTTESRDYWLAKLEAANVPAGPIYTVAEALSSAQIEYRGFVDQGRATRGFTLNGHRPRQSEPPILGQHTQQILKQLGFSESEIENLHFEGVVQ